MNPTGHPQIDLLMMRMKVIQPRLKGLKYTERCEVLRLSGAEDLIKFLRKPSDTTA